MTLSESPRPLKSLLGTSTALFVEACKTVLNYEVYGRRIAEQVVPVVILSGVAAIAFFYTFVALLAWSSVLFGHGPEISFKRHAKIWTKLFKIDFTRSGPVSLPFQTRWSKHVWKILHSDRPQSFFWCLLLP
ncbi:hypothetical protein B0H10DRAFT_2217476 [Mycena sp. CBHHK59/15]|nr:hypothetical protein B0H10DRAFT_2217476 [Mycena sp. CBHHK59/15]